MTTDLETRLRTELPELADELMRDASGHRMVAVALASEVQRPRAHAWWLGVAAAVVAVVVAVVAVSVGVRRDRDGGAKVGTPAPPVVLTGAWHALPASPLSARSNAVAVWTGREVIVWGGHDGLLALQDGAAYDPTRNEWRTITPNSWAHPGAFGVWAGDRMVVLAKNGGATYSPTTDSWTDLPRLDEAGTGGSYGFQAAVWTGRELLGLGLRGVGDGQTELGVNAIDLDGGGWQARTSLRADPGTAGADWTKAASDFQAVWTGHDVVVWFPVPVDGQQGWRYDPEADSWHALPALTMPSGWKLTTSAAGVAGDALHIVASVDSDETNPGGARHSLVATLAADADTWSIATPNRLFVGADRALPVPHALALFAEPDGTPVLLDPTNADAALLTGFPSDAVTGRAAVWAGDGLFVWGGETAPISVPPGSSAGSHTVGTGGFWRPDSN